LKSLLLKLLILSCSCSPVVAPVALPLEQRLKAYAGTAWEAAGVSPGVSYELILLEKDSLDIACNANPLRNVAGCERSPFIYLLASSNEARLSQRTVHEVGHLLANRRDHLKCYDVPGDDVMCSNGASDGTQPTERDVGYVRGEPFSPTAEKQEL
jgi:hypothetical protein